MGRHDADAPLRDRLYSVADGLAQSAYVMLGVIPTDRRPSRSRRGRGAGRINKAERQQQDILRPNEARELSRLEIFLLLAEGNVTEANQQAATLIATTERTAADIALAARCAADAKDHAKAASLMHDALDAGVAINDVKAVALAIAGAAGDKRLTDRVR